MSFPIKWDKPRTPTTEELNQLRKIYNVTILWDGNILLTPKQASEGWTRR